MIDEQRTNYNKMLGIFETLSKDHENRYERALYLLLLEFKAQMPPLETLADYEYFHKAFRQTDVTYSDELDMAIYNLLESSELFWQICEQLFRSTKSEENDD